MPNLAEVTEAEMQWRVGCDGVKRLSGPQMLQLWQQGSSEADDCCLTAWVVAGV